MDRVLPNFADSLVHIILFSTMSIVKKSKKQIFYGLLGLLMVIGIAVCLYVLSDTYMIKRSIAWEKKSTENRNIKDCMKYVSNNYSDSTGNTYDTLETFGIYLFQKASKIVIRIKKTEIEINGNKSTVRITGNIILKIGDVTGILKGDNTPLIIQLSKENGKEWKIISLEGLTFSLSDLKESEELF